ncbi:MAG: HAD family hydrolase [Anaerolineales bacterium]|jgi:putative hydrolase of the HAD superfamily
MDIIIGFDADDTLWDNEVIYHRMKVRFGEILSQHGEPDAIREELDRIEVANIKYYGFGIKSYALSMIETAIDLSNKKINYEEMQALIAGVKEMMATDVELVDQVSDVLRLLSTDYDLLLITKGDTFEQERKITRSGLEEFFRYVEIVGEKTEEQYLRILEKFSYQPNQFLMVGNSLRSDILPVLRIGGSAIYIPNEHTWFHENATDDEIREFDFATLNHLSELPQYISQMEY